MDVLIGTLGRAHGLKGAFAVRLRTDSPEERFAPGARVRLDTEQAPGGGPRWLKVASSGWVGQTFVVRFTWPADRSTAEELRGRLLWADIPDVAEAAGADEYHDTHLIGLEVRDPAGTPLGRVTRVEHPPAQDLLVVRTPAGERLVPFVAALVPKVDVEGGYLVVDAPPGLLNDGGVDAC